MAAEDGAVVDRGDQTVPSRKASKAVSRAVE